MKCMPCELVCVCVCVCGSRVRLGVYLDGAGLAVIVIMTSVWGGGSKEDGQT